MTGVNAKGGIERTPHARMHTIYVGSPEGLPFTRREVALLRSIVAERFVSFTLIDAVGVWLGKGVATKLIKVASDDEDSVIKVCASLCEAFDQDAVGLEMNGQFAQIKAREGKGNNPIASQAEWRGNRCVRRSAQK